jgi:hypothetical protein
MVLMQNSWVNEKQQSIINEPVSTVLKSAATNDKFVSMQGIANGPIINFGPGSGQIDTSSNGATGGTTGASRAQTQQRRCSSQLQTSKQPKNLRD